MRYVSRVPSKLYFLLACMFLLATGTLAARSDERIVAQNPAEHADAPVSVDDALPPHREPPPPPQPPPPPPPPPAPPQSLPADLRTAIVNALSGSAAGSRALVVEVEGLGRVVQENGNAMILPASLTKLYTAGAAMLRLGNDMRFTTEVRRYGTVEPDGTLNGSLVIIGGGDPSLTQAELQELANRVRESGVITVTGNLYADDSRFDRVRSAPGWKPTFFPDEIGSLSALAVDTNVWRTDPAFYADPALWNLELFRQHLGQHGVTVSGTSEVGKPEGNSSELVVAHDSQPMRVLLADMLRRSENFYAELILKELGRAGGGGTTANGTAVLRAVSDELGVGHGQFFDGSGLSLDNRESAAHIVEWLQAIEKHPLGNEFKSLLPSTCSGTRYLLEKRLCGTTAAGKVIAKTGTLAKTRAVAGYTTTASGRRVWMALVLNDVTSTKRAWEAFDRALVAITSFSR